MGQVLDYSAGFPGARAIAEAGYLGAVRYIGYRNRKKCTNRTERLDFAANGLGMALVFENTDTSWRRGYAGGVADATVARADADICGFPADQVIYMAIDQQVVTKAEHATAVAYILGAAAVLGRARTGPYGQYSVIEACADADVADYHWQCRAWSGTPIKYSAHRRLFQQVGTVYVGGIACDVNDVVNADWGQHNAHTLEDDVSFSEPLPNPNYPADKDIGGQPTYLAGDWIVQANLKAGRAATAAEEGLRRMDAILAAVEAATSDPDITEDRMIQIVNEAMPDAAAIAAELRPGLVSEATSALQTVLADVLGADNEDTANEILRLLGERLNPAKEAA